MKTKIKKHMGRLLTAALAIVFAVGFASQMDAPAFADDGDPAITMGTGILAKTANTSDAQVVCFGGREWYVIAYDGKDSKGTPIQYTNPVGGTENLYEDKTIVLFQSDVYEQSIFNTTGNDWNRSGFQAYGADASGEPSDLRKSIEKIYLTGDDENAPIISGRERYALVPRKLPGYGYEWNSYTNPGAYDSNRINLNDLDDALVWPLSDAEVSNVDWGLRVGHGKDYWLRVPGVTSTVVISVKYGAKIQSDGGLYRDEYTVYSNGVRPALYLNETAIVLTSAAYSGKISGRPGPSALKKVTDNTDNTWIVTVKDEPHEHFAVSTIEPGTCMAPKIHYSGAAVGNNEYISALIKDKNGNITYYGRLKQCTNNDDTEGDVTVNLGGKLGKDDTLYVFNEQINGDGLTDFASDLVEIKVTLPMDRGHQLDKTDGIDASCTEPGNREYWTCRLCGQYFGDDQGTQKIKKDSWIIEPYNHDQRRTYVGIIATLDRDGKLITVCDRCHTTINNETIPHPVSFDLSPATGEYNGQPQEPAVTVKDGNGGTIAADNYSVEYDNNIEPGDAASVKVVFNNDRYQCEKDLNFTIAPRKVNVPAGKKLTYNAKNQTGVAAGAYYTVTGNSATKAGSYTATLSLKDPAHYAWNDGKTAAKKVKWAILKAANPLKVKGKTAAVKYSALKKKNQSLGVTKVVAFKNKGQGAKTYIKAAGNKNITIAKKTGKVTVKKGLKKGTYKVTVKVKAAGGTNYKASAVKKVAFKISVK